MKAVVLAAGKGVRMRPLTDEKPKAMVLLKGKPLIQRSMESFGDAGASEILIVTGYMQEQIKEFFRNTFQGIPLEYIVQKEQVGTAHAIGLAKGFVGNENFLVSYSDVILEGDFIRKFWDFGEQHAGAFDAIVAVRHENDVSKFGLVECRGNVVESIVEKPKEKKSGFVNSGLWWFSPKIFSEIEKTKPSKRGEFEITDSVKPLVETQRVGCFELEGRFFDIGNIRELHAAEKELE
ncbi:MAG: NTP transferase domain-containing protein [Candidatus Diapherotrites archaeon]|nr:NTP transferase domain-containing protein [Candidatus Diapherotrites archaeon]